MGATIGATAAPYLVIPLATHAYSETLPWLADFLGHGTGWRVAFIVTGAAGLLWLVPWLLFYRLPRNNRRITTAELELIEEKAAENAQNSDASDEAPWSWRRVLTSRVVWLLLLGRLITDPVWYFYQFWFPKYLNAERGLSQEQLKVTWVIYAAAGVGSLLGGWLSGHLVKRGCAPASSRLWVMLGCACLMPVSPFIARTGDITLALAFTVLAVCAALASLINISSIVVDVVPKSSLGTVFSVVAAGSTLGGILMNTVVATMVSGPAASPGGFLDQTIRAVLSPILSLVQGQGYDQWFLYMGFLHPLAWLMLYFGGVHRRPAPHSA
jgi:ACS family hexuronate transporter-like MFS transporter